MHRTESLIQNVELSNKMKEDISYWVKLCLTHKKYLIDALNTSQTLEINRNKQWKRHTLKLEDNINDINNGTYRYFNVKTTDLIEHAIPLFVSKQIITANRFLHSPQNQEENNTAKEIKSLIKTYAQKAYQDRRKATLNLLQACKTLEATSKKSNNKTFRRAGHKIASIAKTKRNKLTTAELNEFTGFVKGSTDLILAPFDTDHLRTHIANTEAARKPKYDKAIFGAMAAIAGIALIGLSIFAAAATFGASIPISAVTASMGISMITAGLSIGIAATATGTLFAKRKVEGRMHGAMSELKDAALKDNAETKKVNINPRHKR